MLNEIGEFAHYTMSTQEISACQNLRLKYLTLIKREFSGLERPLTIVARHFLFYADGQTIRGESELRKILKTWCGFDDEPHQIKAWLPNYILTVFVSKNVKTCIEKLALLESDDFRDEFTALLKKIPDRYNDEAEISEVLTAFDVFKATHVERLKSLGNEPTQIAASLKALAKLPGKNKNFSKSLFGALTAKGDTPFRAITYDRIIANAFLAGKLRRFYLESDEELFASKKILKDTRKLSPNDKDMILKMTAEYLLKRRDCSQEFVETNDSNILNWMVGARKPENFARDSYMLAERDENIFEVRKVNPDGINALKIKLNPDWTKHFRLVEDCDEESLGRIFFADAGSCERLAQGVLYDAF